MKSHSPLLSLLPLALLLSTPDRGEAALLLRYTFDAEDVGALADGVNVINAGSSGANGTAILPSGTLTIEDVGGVGLGNHLNIQPADDIDEGIAAPHISSGTTLETLAIDGMSDYTMMAWVRFESDTDDNMVFGGDAGDVIHLGSRGSNYWSGHWGDDVNSAGAPSTDMGNWHHVTWTNTGDEQNIIVDGVTAATGGAGAAGGFSANLAETLLIGTSRNRGSFRGAIDDVRVYDELLTSEQIDDIIAEATVVERELLVHYTFDNNPVGPVANGVSIVNSGTSGTDGSAGVPGGTLSINDDAAGRVKGLRGALRNYLVVTPASDADSGIAAPHISTGSALTTLRIDGNMPYTMMAWVRFDNQAGDNMVFGANSVAALQLGSRTDDLFSGHGTGDEIDSADAPNTETGAWHHLAWSNLPVADGENSGAQQIFVDGVSVTGPGATGAVSAIDSNLSQILLVGTSLGGGSFSGALDDIRVYNGLVSTSELDAIILEATRPPGVGEGLLIHYTFDSDPAGLLEDGTQIQNLGASGTDGTATLPDGSMTILNDADRVNGAAGRFGSYINIQPSVDTLEGNAAPHINANRNLDDLGLGGDRDYTMMAWVKFDNQEADNMVFGGNSGDVLHLGSRGANYWSGHWGDDVNSGGAPDTDAGNWHHVTWTNTGLTQEQEIFVDGSSAVTGGAAAAGGFNANLGEDLLIGSSRNAGSFRGSIDDVRVYDTVLPPEDITTIINSTTATDNELEFTAISHDASNNMVTLTFRSTPSKTYALFWTPDLQDGPDYNEINDNVAAHASDPTTTFTIPTPTPAPNPDAIIPARAFFILRENPPPP